MPSFRNALKAATAAVSLALSASALAVTVHVADFIADGSRTGFNGFESIPNDGIYFTGGAGPYIEGGIAVRQINPNPANSIWVTYDPGGRQGSFAWYPEGGDGGWTEITRAGGGDFVDVGMLVGSGGFNDFIRFELYDNGVAVASGSVAHGIPFRYLGFSGGGFDTIWIRDSAAGASFADGSLNALVIDAIEMAGGRQGVPEPGSAALFGAALLAAASIRRKIGGRP